MPCALLACRAVVVAVEFRAIAGFALVERGGPGGASLSAILVVDRSTVVAGRWLGATGCGRAVFFTGAVIA